MSALCIPEAPCAEADAWARTLLRAAGPETPSDESTPFDVPALFEEAARAATDLTLRLPDLYAAHALVAAPRALRERVGALRSAIAAAQRRPEGRP